MSSQFEPLSCSQYKISSLKVLLPGQTMYFNGSFCGLVSGSPLCFLQSALQKTGAPNFVKYETLDTVEVKRMNSDDIGQNANVIRQECHLNFTRCFMRELNSCIESSGLFIVKHHISVVMC